MILSKIENLAAFLWAKRNPNIIYKGFTSDIWPYLKQETKDYWLDVAVIVMEYSKGYPEKFDGDGKF